MIVQEYPQCKMHQGISGIVISIFGRRFNRYTISTYKCFNWTAFHYYTYKYLMQTANKQHYQYYQQSYLAILSFIEKPPLETKVVAVCIPSRAMIRAPQHSYIITLILLSVKLQQLSILDSQSNPAYCSFPFNRFRYNSSWAWSRLACTFLASCSLLTLANGS